MKQATFLCLDHASSRPVTVELPKEREEPKSMPIQHIIVQPKERKPYFEYVIILLLIADIALKLIPRL